MCASETICTRAGKSVERIINRPDPFKATFKDGACQLITLAAAAAAAATTSNET